MDTLENTRIYRELKARSEQGDPVAKALHARLVVALPSFERVLGEIRRYFHHFTDHSVHHSIRIVENIGELLSDQQLKNDRSGLQATISSVDLFMLISAALVHDIGMVVAESEVESLVGSDEFKQFAADSPSSGGDDDWFRYGISRLKLAEFVRRRHPTRSMKMVLDGVHLPRSLTESAPMIEHWLGLIAAGHGLDFREICDSSTFPSHVKLQLGGSLQGTFNPRFVALCLRLGDLLDIGTARVCPLLRGLSEPLSCLSESHWEQYSRITIADLKPGHDIKIIGTCPTQEAERVLREWVRWLEEEAAQAVTLQNTDEACYRLATGRVLFEVKPALVAGRPAYEFLEYRFNLDEKQVFERLFGVALYGKPEVALRELVQNAVDAQRALVVHRLSQRDSWQTLSEDDRLRVYRTELDAVRHTLPIRIAMTRRKVDGKERTWLSVLDGGIGMSRDAIGKYLLKVGRSRWMDDTLTSKLGIGTKSIGTFGVGFLSTLMLAERVVVDTKSCLPQEDGIEATIYGWQGFAATAPSTRSGSGTTISLMLNEALAFTKGIEQTPVELCDLLAVAARSG
jgi:molecular chaperone HtpG